MYKCNWENIVERKQSGPDRNRTCISSSGDLRSIHSTTGPCYRLRNLILVCIKKADQWTGFSLSVAGVGLEPTIFGL